MEAGQNKGKRDHLSIHFTCCNTYGHIYKNKAGNAYSGFCPRCMRKVQVKISPDGSGTGQRIFQAG